MPEDLINCFYCDEVLQEHDYQEGATVPLDACTRDHVVPRKLGREWGTPYREYYVKSENIVPSCPRCNTRKGSKDPLDWIVSYRLGDLGAERLRDRLLLLGFPVDRVEHAWKHRLAAIANREKQLALEAIKRAAELNERFRRRAEKESGQDGNAAAC